MHSHACVPTALPPENGRIRLFFAPRNQNGQSIPSYIDLSADNPSELLEIGKEPIMQLGELGTFDDGGIMPCSIQKHKDDLYLYYVGWNPSVSVAYRNAVGLAISEDGGKTFERAFKGAVVDRSATEPYFTASPCVLKLKDTWHMWYASGTGFLVVNGRTEPLYKIKYAQSQDGKNWKRTNHTCIEPLDQYEANARPTVIFENGLFRMWFCFRGSFDYRDGQDSYKIGYAESKDGLSWTRKDDEAGISYSTKGWDSTMQTYPNVIRWKDTYLMFYNGNGFGKTGIGYAIYE
jgi:predicted GH43/DUF377 family glycosyl hydrolase